MFTFSLSQTSDNYKMILQALILVTIPLVYAAYTDGGRVVTSSGSRDLEYSIPGISRGSVTGIEKTGSSVNVCRQCEYLGATYEGNSPFTFERGCWQYNCFCNCDGGFNCPHDRSRYLCGGSEECVRCDVTAYNGSYEEPNTDFRIRRGCESYNNCRCHCDGGWSCDEGVYTCTIETGCMVDSTRYASGQTFDLIRGCDKYTDCVCNQGGDWKCNQATDTCGKCRKCKIGEDYYDGDTESFPARTNCTTYRSCDCKCDGTYICRGGINTCNGENQLTDGQCPDCIIDGVRYRNGESFNYQTSCLEHSDCQCRCGSAACRKVTETCGDCRSCNVDGEEYATGSVFSHKQGCYEYKQCECNCDGRWECFGDTAVDTCNTCKKCNADGTSYEAYSKFNVDRRCWNYQCFCLCNGTTWCPSATVVNTCTQPDRCLRCEVDGREIRGNTHFKYELNGMDMHCRCNCDGSHVCVAEWLYVRTDLSISGSGIGSGGSGCFSCIMDGTSYRGDTKYKIIRSGITMDCDCNCDGSYVCYGEKYSEYQGCLGCTVAGTSYNGNNSFSIVYKGMKLECQCSCNGSYMCTGSMHESTEAYIVQCLSYGMFGCLPDTGVRCINNGMVYNAGGNFMFQYESVSVNCICGIDGSYYCEAMSGLVLSCVGGACVEIGCKPCVVDGLAHRYNTQFSHKYNNIDMLCTCSCDGASYCVGIETFINVTCIDGACSQVGCVSCEYCGLKYQGGSKFNLIHRGLRMECSCECDSSYRCVTSTLDDVFECDPGRSCGPKRCKKCRVDGRRYKGRSVFNYDYLGTAVSCTCGCDGSYFCHGTSTEIEISCPKGRACQIIGGCGSCFVNGKQYENGQEYEIATGSGRQRCQCNCDGTSECSTIARPTCSFCTVDGVVYEGHTRNRINRNSESYICDCYCNGTHKCEVEYPPTCKQCEVAGTMYTGDTKFQASIESTLMQCSCDCDGKYECVSEYKRCTPHGCRNTCQYCDIDGQRYTGNPGYRFEANVFGLDMQCLCNCDGSYHCTCPTRTCTSTSGCVDNCQPCSIDNRHFEENMDFLANVFGHQMRCSCNCNGIYRCISEMRTCSSISGCVDNCLSCVIDNKRYRKNSNFQADVFGYHMQCSCECDGNYRCTSETQVCTASGCVANCRQCIIDNQRFDRNSNFQADVYGDRMQCGCDCSGSYRCTSETQICTSSGCVDNCRQCLIDDRRFSMSSNFQADVYGYRMQCSCECDGTYRCISETQVCTSSGCVASCRQCLIDNQRFDRNPNFQADVYGYRMQCSCECDGTYRCISETQVCTSSGCVANCRQCLIDNQRFDRNPNFQADVYGYRMQCSCECDGSYRCISDSQTCTSSGCVDNCRPCLIDGRRYSRSTNFQADVFGYRMQCSCECDGSYRCESDTRTCSSSAGCVNRCQNCIINGVRHDGNTNFNAFLEGIPMKCTCDCNGNYECRGGTYTCTSRGCENSCAGCLVEGKSYQGNTTFDIFYNAYGIDMTCECACGGSYTCRGTKEVTSCGESSCSRTGCHSCNINGVTYRGGSTFQTRIDNLIMDCKCSCNGGYRCKGARNQTGSITTQESEMRRTVVAIRPVGYGKTRLQSEARTYGDGYTSNTFTRTVGRSESSRRTSSSGGRNTNTSRMMSEDNTSVGRKECISRRRRRRFSYEEKCRRYYCRCDKNGKFKCDPEKTKITC